MFILLSHRYERLDDHHLEQAFVYRLRSAPGSAPQMKQEEAGPESGAVGEDAGGGATSGLAGKRWIGVVA